MLSFRGSKEREPQAFELTSPMTLKTSDGFAKVYRFFLFPGNKFRQQHKLFLGFNLGQIDLHRKSPQHVLNLSH